jgi:DNA-binding MarR family transcriptional regulator
MILQVLLGAQQMKMNELARYLGLSKANASGLVDRLVKKGLIDRSHGVEDRRVVLVRLTRVGRRVAANMVQVQRRGLSAMMHRIPDKNLGVFIETLEQVAKGMAESQRDLLPFPRR